MTDLGFDTNNEFPGTLGHMDCMISGKIRPKFGPLDHNPCANVVVANAWACPSPGTLACSACKLVSYCSKVRLFFLFGINSPWVVTSRALRSVRRLIGSNIRRVSGYLYRRVYFLILSNH